MELFATIVELGLGVLGLAVGIWLPLHLRGKKLIIQGGVLVAAMILSMITGLMLLQLIFSVSNTASSQPLWMGWLLGAVLCMLCFFLGYMMVGTITVGIRLFKIAKDKLL